MKRLIPFSQVTWRNTSGDARRLQQAQCFPGHTLTSQPVCLRIVILRDAPAFAVRATAITAEDQFALVASDKPSGEIRIAGQRIISGVRRHVRIEIREIGQPAVGQTSRFDWSRWITAIRRHVGADVSPEQVPVPDKMGSRVGFEAFCRTECSRYCREALPQNAGKVWMCIMTGTCNSAATS